MCKNERKVSAGSGSRPDRAGATGSLLTSWLESIRSWEGRTRLAEIDVEGRGEQLSDFVPGGGSLFGEGEI